MIRILLLILLYKNHIDLCIEFQDCYLDIYKISTPASHEEDSSLLNRSILKGFLRKNYVLQYLNNWFYFHACDACRFLICFTLLSLKPNKKRKEYRKAMNKFPDALYLAWCTRGWSKVSMSQVYSNQ